MKIWILYDTKHGNNKQIAEVLSDLFKEGNIVHVSQAKDVSPKEIADDKPDILLFGGPIHVGMISFTMKGWVSKFASILKSKQIKLQKVGVWGTHLREVPDMPPKLAWSTTAPKWKALMDEVLSEKTIPDVQGIIVEDMKSPMEPSWKEIVTGFAERVKGL